MKKIAVSMALAAAALGALGACTDAKTQKRLEELESRVAKMEKGGGGGGDVDARLKKVEGFLGPYMNQPPPPPEPDPAATYAVPVDGNHFTGPATAPVTIVEAFEYACPYCYRVNPTIDQLLKDYEGKVRVVYKNFIVHPQQATLPALAACAAGEQGKYKEYSHLLWEKGFTKGGYSEELIDSLAKELKLDEKKFKADRTGERCQKLIAEDQAELGKVGVSGTPAFYINGRFLGGAQPVENFKKIVDEELKKAEEKIAAGTPADQYYQKFVVEAGVKELEAPKAEGQK